MLRIGAYASLGVSTFQTIQTTHTTEKRMSWIKMRTSLSVHPKVLSMTVRLCCAQAQQERNGSATQPQQVFGRDATLSLVIGCLCRFWVCADQHADADGVLGMSVQAIDMLVGVEGFAEALIAVGWLIDVDGESVQVVDYQAHNGTTAKSRASSQRRMAASRQHKSNPKQNHPVAPKRNTSATQAQPEKRREEKRREEKNIHTPREKISGCLKETKLAEPAPTAEQPSDLHPRHHNTASRAPNRESFTQASDQGERAINTPEWAERCVWRSQAISGVDKHSTNLLDDAYEAIDGLCVHTRGPGRGITAARGEHLKVERYIAEECFVDDGVLRVSKVQEACKLLECSNISKSNIAYILGCVRGEVTNLLAPAGQTAKPKKPRWEVEEDAARKRKMDILKSHTHTQGETA